MVQIPSCLNFTFKELSNEYSHAQIRVKMKKLWPRQVREEKLVAVQKISRDRKCCRDRKLVSRQKVGVTTESWCRDRKLVSQQKMVSRQKTCVATRNAAET